MIKMRVGGRKKGGSRGFKKKRTIVRAKEKEKNVLT